MFKRSQIKYYEELFDNHKNSVYNLWKTLNHIINPKRGKSFSPVKKLIIGRKAIIDKQEISNSMNEHFCNIGNELQSEIPDYGHKYRDYMPQRINQSFYLEPITSNDIVCEIKRLRHNKSPGHDLIGSKVIKLCPEISQWICLRYTTGESKTENILQVWKLQKWLYCIKKE